MTLSTMVYPSVEGQSSKVSLPSLRQIKKVKGAHLKHTLKIQSRLQKEATRRLQENEVLLANEKGKIEGTSRERSYKLKQTDLLESLNSNSVQNKIFEFNLSYGPYLGQYSENGRHLLMAGQKGAVSILDCHRACLDTEFQVHETIRDAIFLNASLTVATAQKKYIHIYDCQGIELHCLKQQMLPYALGYLPYHFLMTSIGEFGDLCYRDVSTGEVMATHKTKRGPCRVLRNNPSNAVACLGHSRGVVTMWTPNMAKPVVEMLCHKGNITALDVSGHYMYTAGLDLNWSVWDLRKYQKLHDFMYFGHPPSSLKCSQTGLVAVGFGPHVQIWQNVTQTSKPKVHYLKHDYNGELVTSLSFRPFEDFCNVGRSNGISTLIVPGAGYANFDASEVNPFESKKQRQEREVRRLLEKIQPDMITLQPQQLGLIDTAPRAVKLAEKVERESQTPLKKKIKKKMRGKRSVGNIQKNLKKKYLESVRTAAKERLTSSDKAAVVTSSLKFKLQESDLNWSALKRFS